MEILRRDVVEPRRRRAVAGAASQKARPDFDRDGDPFTVAGNVQPFLRALYLQLALAPRPPAERADLLLTLIGLLQKVNPHYLG